MNIDEIIKDRGFQLKQYVGLGMSQKACNRLVNSIISDALELTPKKYDINEIEVEKPDWAEFSIDNNLKVDINAEIEFHKLEKAYKEAKTHKEWSEYWKEQAEEGLRVSNDMFQTAKQNAIDRDKYKGEIKELKQEVERLKNDLMNHTQ